MAAQEILNACLDTGNETAWTAFVERFQPVIASGILRVVRRYGAPNPALVDDLVQETYLRLCKDNCRSLREFRAQHDEAIFGYLKVVAISVALDHFRARATHKRRGEIEDDGAILAASVSPAGIEQATLLKQIDQHLADFESERDRTIFWLYYRQGYTANDIASFPHLGLTKKGVESCIYRLTQSLRGFVDASSKGLPPKSALGGMK